MDTPVEKTFYSSGCTITLQGKNTAVFFPNKVVTELFKRFVEEVSVDSESIGKLFNVRFTNGRIFLQDGKFTSCQLLILFCKQIHQPLPAGYLGEFSGLHLFLRSAESYILKERSGTKWMDYELDDPYNLKQTLNNFNPYLENADTYDIGQEGAKLVRNQQDNTCCLMLPLAYITKQFIYPKTHFYHFNIDHDGNQNIFGNSMLQIINDYVVIAPFNGKFGVLFADETPCIIFENENQRKTLHQYFNFSQLGNQQYNKQFEVDVKLLPLDLQRDIIINKIILAIAKYYQLNPSTMMDIDTYALLKVLRGNNRNQKAEALEFLLHGNIPLLHALSQRLNPILATTKNQIKRVPLQESWQNLRNTVLSSSFPSSQEEDDMLAYLKAVQQYRFTYDQTQEQAILKEIKDEYHEMEMPADKLSSATPSDQPIQQSFLDSIKTLLLPVIDLYKKKEESGLQLFGFHKGVHRANALLNIFKAPEADISPNCLTLILDAIIRVEKSELTAQLGNRLTPEQKETLATKAGNLAVEKDLNLDAIQQKILTKLKNSPLTTRWTDAFLLELPPTNVLQ